MTPTLRTSTSRASSKALSKANNSARSVHSAKSASLSKTKDSLSTPSRTGTKAKSTSSDDQGLADRKWQAYSAHASTSPYPEFTSPTTEQCKAAHTVLTTMHKAQVDKEFEDPDTPDTIPHVLDAMVVGVLSQATGWSNAKRAMASMRSVYGSVFAYDSIVQGGMDKLQQALKPGGLHVRKSGLIMGILNQAQKEHPDWNLDHLFQLDDMAATKELIKYKGMGPKTASVVMTWCLKRTSFTVDTHVYRIAGLWNWRPQQATRETAQAHLDARIPNDLKFDLHFLLIAHGRTCPACRGGAKPGQRCEAKRAIDSETGI